MACPLTSHQQGLITTPVSQIRTMDTQWPAAYLPSAGSDYYPRLTDTDHGHTVACPLTSHQQGLITTPVSQIRTMDTQWPARLPPLSLV